MIQKPVVWTIAGSDSCSGAGLQADLSAFKDFNVHGCCVVTTVTAQSPTSVRVIEHCSAALVAEQIETMHLSLSPQVVKLGALGSLDNVRVISRYLKSYSGSVICDPVLRATEGGQLLATDAEEYLKNVIFPYATLITPNIPEAEALLGITIHNPLDMERAAQEFLKKGIKNVLIKGGHLSGKIAQDYFLNANHAFWLKSPKQGTGSFHGTGCTLSSAITAAIAVGYNLLDAVVIAKMYLNQAIRRRYCFGDSIFLAREGWPDHPDDLPWIDLNYDRKRLQFSNIGDAPVGFYPIVESATWIERLLSQGINTIQLRIKNQSADKTKTAIQKSVACARTYGARLFINDYWEWAIEEGAYGVHLGQSDLLTADLQAIQHAGLRLGVSTHSFYEVACAHALQPSYVAYGPIYHTFSKSMPFSPQGLERLRYWKKALTYPVIAIGGITVREAKDVLLTGVSGIAVLSAVTQSANVEKAVRDFLYVTQT